MVDGGPASGEGYVRADVEDSFKVGERLERRLGGVSAAAGSASMGSELEYLKVG